MDSSDYCFLAFGVMFIQLEESECKKKNSKGEIQTFKGKTLKFGFDFEGKLVILTVVAVFVVELLVKNLLLTL
ncbi:MAG: hypothetical protein ACTSW1_14330 [Candidatus Hodarchaeales archaeon]